MKAKALKLAAIAASECRGNSIFEARTTLQKKKDRFLIKDLIRV